MNFDPIWCSPKPLQKPYPPILLGTHTGPGLDRVARYCDGWIPVGGGVQDLGESLKDLRARADRAGRRSQDLSVSLFMVADNETTLRQYQEVGAERAVFGVPSEGREKVLPLLDKYATLVPKFA